MTPLLILVLSLAAPPQEAVRERVRDSIASYFSPRTKAEERARIVERLGAMGPASVGVLQDLADVQGHRAGFPPTRSLAGDVKMDLLRRLGDERGAQAILRLRSQMGSIQASELSLESILDELRRQGIGPVLVNPVEQDELAGLRFTARSSGDPMDVILDRMLQKHRLDYYARGSLVVIASRSWLWGSLRPAPADAALQSRLAEALGQLESELIDRRTGAERTIIEAGPAALPVLEKEMGRAGAARKERLEALVDRILSRHIPDRLHPPEAEPGFVSEEALEFHRASKERQVNISFFRATPLSEIVARIAEFSEIAIAIDPSLPAAVAGRKLTLAVERGAVLEVLEGLVLPLGGAVKPEAGRLLIVPRR